ncbi:hypothetical protein D3C72_1537920 [compost metagenome]
MTNSQRQPGGTGIGHFIDHDRHVRRCAAGAAVLYRHIGQDHAHLPGCQPRSAVSLVLFAPFFFQWRQGLGDKTTDTVGEWRNVLVQPGRTVVIQHGEGLECLGILMPDAPWGASRTRIALRWRRDHRRRPGSGRRRSWLPAGTTSPRNLRLRPGCLDGPTESPGSRHRSWPSARRP